MPELPEVETVARDLRPKLVGATIVGARTNWVRTLRSQDPGAFADGVTGRTVEAVGRRAKLVVVDLTGEAALTIHLKMTGQIFVVPADWPEDAYIRLVCEEMIPTVAKQKLATSCRRKREVCGICEQLLLLPHDQIAKAIYPA